MWARFARALGRFSHGLYLSDLILRDGNRDLVTTTFAALLGVFVRGRVHVHFSSTEDAVQALEDAGFDALLHDPRDFAGELVDLERAGAGRVRVIEANA